MTEQTMAEQTLAHLNQDPQPEKKQDDFEQKYAVLQGKYNKEIPALNQQNADLKKSNTELSERIAALESRATEIKAPPQQPMTASQFAADYPGVVEEITQNIRTEMATTMSQNLAPVTQQVKELEQHTTSQNEESRKALLRTDLRASDIDFDAVNSDPAFVEYLSQVEPSSGLKRQEIVNTAFSNGDISTVAYHVRQFSQTQARPNPASHLSYESTSTGGQSQPNVWTKEKVDWLNAQQNILSRGGRAEITQDEADRLYKDLTHS